MASIMCVQRDLLTPVETAPTKFDPAQEFDRFWMIYPRRCGSNPKKPARDKFIAFVTKKHIDPGIIIAGAEKYARMRQGQDPKFTCMAVTWLNQERWSDDYSIEPPHNSSYMDLEQELWARVDARYGH